MATRVFETVTYVNMAQAPTAIPWLIGVHHPNPHSYEDVGVEAWIQLNGIDTKLLAPRVNVSREHDWTLYFCWCVSILSLVGILLLWLLQVVGCL